MKPKKLLSFLLATAMTISLLPTFTLTASADETPTTTTEKNITLGASALKGGQASNVYFGTYQQSSLGNTEPTEGTEGIDWIKNSNGQINSQGAYYKKDPIKWRVLSNADGKAFLLSDKNLDVVRYHEDCEAVTWATSTIRSWLNGYGASSNTGGGEEVSGINYTSDNFIGSAFSDSEQQAIVETNVVTTYNTEGGDDATDKVFLLSIAEAQNTAYGFTDNTSSTDTRKAVNTAYVRGGGKTGTKLMCDVDNADCRWLRSPGTKTDYAAYVYGDGVVSNYGCSVDSVLHAVRPAFNLNLSSVIFTSAAKGGKSSTAAVGGGAGIFENVDLSTLEGNDGYKLTMKDSKREFTVTEKSATGTKGETITLNYDKAQTGTKEYISAMIVKDGEVLYYGQGEKTDTSTNNDNPVTEKGKVKFTLPDEIENGEYKLYVFNEQINGDEKTDFSSAFQTVTLNVEKAEAQVVTKTGQTTTGTLADMLEIAKVNEDSTVTLLKDYTGNIKIDGGKFNFDAGEFNFNGTGEAFSSVNNIYIGSNAELTIIGGTFNLPNRYYAIDNHGILNITGGTFTNRIVNVGNLNITGDAVIDKLTVYTETHTVISGGQIKTLIASYTNDDYACGYDMPDIKINGGKFKKIQSMVALELEEFVEPQPFSEILADGYAFKYKGDWIDGTLCEVGDENGTDFVTVAKIPIISCKTSAACPDVYSTPSTFKIYDIVVAEGYSAADITFEWKDNTNTVSSTTDTWSQVLDAGEHNVTCTMTLNGYSVTKTFEPKTIAEKNISGAEITLGDSLTYNGTEQTQTVTNVEVDGLTLTENTDYTVSGNTATDAGSGYELTVTGIGNFTGTATKRFTVAEADTQTTVTPSTTVVTYGDTLTLTARVLKSARARDKVDFYVGEGDDAEHIGTADVTYTDGTATLELKVTDTNYKNLKIGENKITAEYGGSVNLNGSGSDAITVTLKPKPVGLSWSGYDTRDYDGQQSNVTATATGIEDGDGEIGVTVTGGKETNADTHTATATELTGTNAKYYKLPTATTQDYTISPKSVTATIDEIADQTYTGREIKPTITVKDGDTTIPESEYDVVYSNNKHAGQATVTLNDKANGNYTVSGSTTFEILPKNIDGATVGIFAEMTYNGTEQTPSAEVSIDGLIATGTWSKVTNIGDKTTFTADGNFAGEISNKSTGMKKLPVIIEWINTEGLVFDKTKKTITAEVSNKKCDDVVNLTIDGDLTGTSKGTYTATVTAVNNENYTIENGQNLEKKWVISQAKDNAITNLAINGWIYGDAENIPTANAKYGTPTFAYSEDENGGYAATVPTNAGTYWVKATVAGTEDYAEVSSEPISFTIAKANSSVITAPTKAENLVYTGEELTLLTADGDAEGGTIKYSIDETNFTYDFADIPKVIDAKDDYKVWYKVVGDENHNDTASVCIEIKVAKKPINTAITLTAPVRYATPKTSIETDEYTATVVWSPEIAEGGTFAKSTEYTATITVTPQANYTTDGITEYVIDGAETVTLNTDGTITAVFPKTAGSTGGGGGTSRYTVKFDTDGGNTITNQTVTKNSKAAEPTAPTKEGYIFDGWYTDSKFTTEYDFDTKVSKNITLYAKWVEDEVQEPSDDKKDDEQKPTTDEWKNPFTDVTTVDWFFGNIRYANENGLMSGTTDTTFAPNDSLTRAMLVTVLWRADGEPVVNYAMPFTDIIDTAYYAEAVRWAASENIVNGVTETEFAPDMNITREQIAAIIYRYAKYKGIAPTGAWAIKLDYADVADISDYAAEGVMYCTMKNIMQGKDNNMFAPKDNATRAEIAAILQRFIEGNK